ncbi:HPr kinase/phosphorylase [Roseobacter litoralis]|uniref:HPr serine kinase-like protein n=1 Tax=Roseobacter litoralis (strain ATCC 49566 / DSM 6996 / JCM 21268 / NBRC 15278 / OCh 149) TaxID=391595 RepID=F7ZLV3_ROSLO|nr:HPr kinase/phosphatase C-terminal domain-containing protein [Roseobacter litoralis]AEI95347.1 HPr serine kinase-like protein [Roseobacter litoralis Och 149]
MPAQMLHATCVDFQSKGVLITGRSGKGKSALALQLMAYGAVLVSDDQTEVSAKDGKVCARAPRPTHGMIEVRGIGLLNAQALTSSTVELVVDLDQLETERLPHLHGTDVCGLTLPCLYYFDAPHFPAGILQYLKAGRREPHD